MVQSCSISKKICEKHCLGNHIFVLKVPVYEDGEKPRFCGHSDDLWVNLSPLVTTRHQPRHIVIELDPDPASKKPKPALQSQEAGRKLVGN